MKVMKKNVGEYKKELLFLNKRLTSLTMSREALADNTEIASLGRKYPWLMVSMKPSL